MADPNEQITFDGYTRVSRVSGRDKGEKKASFINPEVQKAHIEGWAKGRGVTISRWRLWCLIELARSPDGEPLLGSGEVSESSLGPKDSETGLRRSGVDQTVHRSGSGPKPALGRLV